MNYEEFVNQKKVFSIPSGHEPGEINSMAFDFQRDIIRWAIRRGRAAVWCDCGLGKSMIQLEWARHVPGDVLILAPLSVSHQTKREGEKFGITTNLCRSQDQVKPGINITNYEMLDKFNVSNFAGVVLDESGILKSHDGKFRNLIIDTFSKTPYRLACSATPAPNDFMELGSHSEFLGELTRSEMLSMFFVHNGGDTSKWRLKGHAEIPFWQWMCSWAVNIRKPSDIGYDDGDFTLPALNMVQHVVKCDKISDHLFHMEARTLQERQQARRETTEQRSAKCAELVNASDEQWLVWCNMNDEGQTIKKMIPGSVEISGSDSIEAKEKAISGFLDGLIRVLISKPRIFGYGLNLQQCCNEAFVGLSDSYEQFYQAVRRCWRFGQKRTVNVHVITAETEGAVVRNIKRKEEDAMRMADEMVRNMADITKHQIGAPAVNDKSYRPAVVMGLPSFLEGI